MMADMRFSSLCFLALMGLVCGNARAAESLTNSGFEAAEATAGWIVATYGAAPRLELDRQVLRQGGQSLRITAGEPSDTALAQELALEPNQSYRFSAWVRTRGLDAREAPVAGTLQVQRPNGAGLIAGGASHFGDTEWTNVAVYFRAPPDGRVRACLFFVGFGRGTGTAWFDEARLEPVQARQAPLRIRPEPLTKARISPMQYGQFVEYLCDLVPAMWAERLYDGSFEGLSPYNFAFITQTDFREKPWHPSGAVNRGRYVLDKTQKISGEVSQKIEAAGPEPCTLGLSQDGIFVDRGRACVFQCWLRAEGLRGPVRVKLHHEGAVYAAGSLAPGGEWKKFTLNLTSAARDEHATLTFEFRGPGTLWLDNASLMPADTVGGWRPDVVAAVRALKPRIIRFGGSAVDEPGFGDFEWKHTVGDPDRRRPFRAWGGLQPTGPGLEEFVQFCRAVQAEPLLCVRFSNRTPREAAEEVEYFNGATNTPMGAWRLRNGHAEPYRVKYWQIGNERQSREYDAQVAAFCRAMKAVDPGIRLLSSFPTAAALREAGAYLDYVCPHHYTPDLAACESNLEQVRQLLRVNAPGANIKVGVTEWNTTAGDWGLGRASLMTLANALACSRYHNLLHRHADLVEIANRSNLINSFGSGIVQTDHHRLYKTPTYYAQQLYATRAGERALAIESDVPANFGLDLSATLSADGRKLVLFAVNDTLQDITRPVDLSAFGTRGQRVSVWTLADRDHAGEPDARNGFGDPERIHVKQSTFRAHSPCFEGRFPALSLTVLEWSVGR
jgi:alpha-N-arabinofuranosidase